MPLNLSSGRSYDWDKEAAFQRDIFGLESKSMGSNAGALSLAEADRLRELLFAHDRQQSSNVFDLSKPPVVPYQHKKFPVTVYNHESSEPPAIELRRYPDGREDEVHVGAKLVTRVVRDEEELSAAVAEGWALDVPTFDVGEAEEHERAAVVVKRTVGRKTKRGA